jgi:hypothetical protein
VFAVGGVVVYVWQGAALKRLENETQAAKETLGKQITELQNQISQLRGEQKLEPQPQQPAGELQPPTGWKVYKNQKYNISLLYPENWHYSEQSPSPTSGSQLLFSAFFDEKTIVGPATDATARPISVSVWNKPLSAIVESYRSAGSLPERTFQTGKNVSVTEFKGFSEFTGENEVHYFMEYNGRAYSLISKERVKDVAAQMLNSVTFEDQ